MELSSEDWVLTQLPRLEKQTTGDSGDEEPGPSRAVASVTNLPGLSRPVLPVAPVNRPYGPAGSRRASAKGPSASRPSTDVDPPWPNKKKASRH